MNTLSKELAYVRSIAQRTPALQRERELELIRRFQSRNDRRAADLLVRAYLRLVIAKAVKYRHYGVPVSDLVAEGNCGLLTALRKFDPERGVRFSTYAKYWVRAYMVGYVIRSSSLVGGKSGLVAHRYFFKLRRERARIAALLGEGADADEELARRMALPLEEVRRLVGCLECRRVSLDAPDPHTPKERMAEALVSDDGPEDRYFRRSQDSIATAAVSVALRGLDARERFIAEYRLLATDAEQLTLSEIGEGWALSRERIRQLETRTKRKLETSPAIRDNASLNEWFAD